MKKHVKMTDATVRMRRGDEDPIHRRIRRLIWTSVITVAVFNLSLWILVL